MKVVRRNSRKPSSAAPQSGAAKAILDVAERLAQTRGYNGFSYADIAAELGVTKAGLHYHFPSKAALGRALIQRYEAEFGAALDTIDRAAADPRERLRQYAGLYESVVRDNRLCLCGMLAAEYATLPAAMQAELRKFFDMNERWLARVLGEGQRSGVFAYNESANERARIVIGTLEGAMLIARSYGDARRFQAAAAHMLADLVSGRKKLSGTLSGKGS